MMTESVRFRCVLFALAAYVVSSAVPIDADAQQLFAYPSQGQSPEQQAQDAGECNQWAGSQTGFNPNIPPPQAQMPMMAPPPPVSGGALPGAARGAALGAVGGAIGGDAGQGAAIGATTGALAGVMKRRSRAREQAEWQEHQQAMLQQQQMAIAQQQAQGMETFNRAYAACMTARGYSIQ